MPSVTSRISQPTRTTAVRAMDLRQAGNKTTVKIDFRAAASAAQGAEKFKLGETKTANVFLERLPPGRVADPNLPPYIVVLEGKDEWSGLKTKHGISSFTGHIADAGTNEYSVYKNANETDGTPLEKLTVKLDVTNDYGARVDPAPTRASRPYREAWAKFAHKADGLTSFDLDKGLQSGALKEVSALDMRRLPGPAALIRQFEKDEQQPVEDLSGIKFVYEPKTASYAVAQFVEGEIEHWVNVFDKTGKPIGQYEVDADGRKHWHEAPPPRAQGAGWSPP